MSDTKTEALAVRPQRTFSLMPSSFGEAREIATMIARSDFAPKDYRDKPDNVLIAIQMGADLGLKPMQALQNIAVINGRPAIWGDAALALAMDVLERFHEEFTGVYPNDDFTAVCTSHRKGWPDTTIRHFSIGDAKAAKLWMKRGHNGADTPWVTYPKRMLQLRARGFNLRDVASDRLLGLVLAEEAMDYPPIDGSVIASELVETSPVSLLDKVPEGLRDNIEKAFATLNLAPGLRLAKINEFMTGDGVDPEVGAQALLEWCKDEFAKRKTGQPRKKKDDGNGKRTEAPATTDGSGDSKGTDPHQAGSVAGTQAQTGSEDRRAEPATATAEVRQQPVTMLPTSDLF